MQSGVADRRLIADDKFELRDFFPPEDGLGRLGECSPLYNYSFDMIESRVILISKSNLTSRTQYSWKLAIMPYPDEVQGFQVDGPDSWAVFHKRFVSKTVAIYY